MNRAQPSVVAAVVELVNDGLGKGSRRPLVLGICGAQGSGKSTLAAAVLDRLHGEGVHGAVLSLDDLYLTREERQKLAREVHPLLGTRGVPGTHDVGLGLALFDAIARGEPVSLPRFDKATDDTLARELWPHIAAETDVIVFEGWCVGAAPEQPASLSSPVNRLEANEDPDGIWRTYVNRRLGAEYQQLFARIDHLVLLEAPEFEVVARWRLEQEEELRRTRAVILDHAMMDAAGVARFVQFYERLTLHILAEMPPRADLLVRLDASRKALSIVRKLA